MYSALSLLVSCLQKGGGRASLSRDQHSYCHRNILTFAQLLHLFPPCLPASLANGGGTAAAEFVGSKNPFFLPILSSGLPLPLTGKFQGEFLEWKLGGEFLALVFFVEAVLVRRGREHLSQTIRPCQAVSQTGFCIQE